MELISDGTHWAVKSKLRLPAIVTRISVRLLESRGPTRYPRRIIRKIRRISRDRVIILTELFAP